MSSQTKYIFVTGGVSSSLGKGIIAASLAKLLQAQGYKKSKKNKKKPKKKPSSKKKRGNHY